MKVAVGSTGRMWMAAMFAVIVMAAGTWAQDTYVIIKIGDRFTALKDDEAVSVGANKTDIQDVIDAIKTDAGGESCNIQFGNNDNTLDIGEGIIRFDGGDNGMDWGVVTLSGKLRSSFSFPFNDIVRYGAIYLTNGVSIESVAEITDSSSLSVCAIYNASTGMVTINGGTVSSYFSVDYQITGSFNRCISYAIYNASTGSVTINEGTVSSSSRTSNYVNSSYAIYNESSGTVTINGGMVSSSSNSKNSCFSYGIYNASTGSVIINDGAVSSSTTSTSSPSSPSSYGIYNASIGAVIINDGAVSTTTTTTSSSPSSSSNGIYNESTGSVAINGGTVSSSAKSDFYGIYNASTGSVTVDGGTVPSTIYGDGTITINNGIVSSVRKGYRYPGIVVINGGTISGDVSADSATITGGNIYGGVYASSITITDGSISGGVGSTGDVTLTGGSISGGVSADSVTLGGSPEISGTILPNDKMVRVITNGDYIFAPKDKIYALSFGDSYLIDEVAVAGGAEFLSNFVLYNPTEYRLAVNGNDIVIKYTATAVLHTVSFNLNGGSGTAPPSFKVLSGSKLPKVPTTGFTKNGQVNDGKWYTDAVGTTEFVFGANGTAVTEDITLYLKWTQANAVLTPTRIVPQAKPSEEAVVTVPAVILAGEFTVGPNPVSRLAGVVNFFRRGKRVSNTKLRIYDATGNVVAKVQISDNALGNQTRRKVGSWDLTDKNGRLVSEGTYLVKGVLKTSDGKTEKVSVIVGVR